MLVLIVTILFNFFFIYTNLLVCGYFTNRARDLFTERGLSNNNSKEQKRINRDDLHEMLHRTLEYVQAKRKAEEKEELRKLHNRHINI